MKDLTIIIPLHEFNEVVREYTKKAIDSVIEQKVKPGKVSFVLSPGLSEDFGDFFNTTSDKLKEVDIKSSFILNPGKSDFCSQINFAVNEIETKYFSILECDDTYTKIWFDNVEKHVKLNDEISIYMPIVNTLNKDGKFFKFMNEVVHATSFSSELGFIDEESLLTYFDYQLPGSVIKTEDFIEVGGLKASIKISFWYEFLLRLVSQSKIVYVIPKIGYNHILGRADSLIDTYEQTVKQEEAKWWSELAQKEYHFKEDRNKVYENN